MTPEKFQHLGVGDVVYANGEGSFVVTQLWGSHAIVTRSQLVTESTACQWDLVQKASHVGNDYKLDARIIEHDKRIAREKEIRANAADATYSAVRFWTAMGLTVLFAAIVIAWATYFR